MTALDPTRSPSKNAPIECICWHKGERWHDWLLTVEQRGLPGLAELIERCSTPEHEQWINGLELPDFMGLHTWDNPTGMYRLATALSTAQAFAWKARAEATKRAEVDIFEPPVERGAA